MKRLLIGSVCTAALALTLSLPVFAGEWKYSEYGWWYDRGDGTCAPTGWHWIDGNNDGIAECYYFNEYCYCVPWSVTPDGYLLDANGAWSVNGIVQTQLVQTNQTAQTNMQANNEENEETAEIIGDYKGSFTDSKGKSSVELSIFEEDGDLMAEFIFYDPEEEDSAKGGSYLCTVTQKEGNTYELRYERWLNQASGYSMRNWTVTLNNKRLEGNVINNKKYTIRCTKRKN